MARSQAQNNQRAQNRDAQKDLERNVEQANWTSFISTRVKFIIVAVLLCLLVIGTSVWIFLAVRMPFKSQEEQDQDLIPSTIDDDRVVVIYPPDRVPTPSPIPTPTPVPTPTLIPTPDPTPTPRPPAQTPTPPTVTPSPSDKYDPGQNAWLTAHNSRRANHCFTDPLKWSKDLEKSAQQWANKCKFEHSERGGENVYMISGFFDKVSAEEVLQQFYDNEIGLYDFENPGFVKGTGHFTQVVWQDSKEVGCATNYCGGWAISVCHYSPNGNVLGQFPSNVGNVKQAGKACQEVIIEPKDYDPGQEAWLSAHNTRRAKHCGTQPLKWNPKLVESAQEWANKCDFEHSDRGGENLYMISGYFDRVYAENVLEQFYEGEIGLYDFDNPRWVKGAGHFTQVVWKGSQEVGCATNDCDGWALSVCHYSPNGNVLGRFGANVGNVCG